MSISRQNLSVVIVSFKSEYIIEKCINSINKEIKIIVVDNSNNQKFKKYIENKYNNIKCILSSENLGMGAGNNLGIKNITNDFALILNPDVALDNKAIDEIINASKDLDTFGILAPISDKTQYPNYKLFKDDDFDLNKPFKVKSVDGFAMLLNLKRLKKLKDFIFFDENFFLYLENDDLCKELINRKENIYIVPKSKINHLGGKAVDIKYKDEIELCRNWHWMWSKFYFNKKHYGFIKAFINIFYNLVSAKIKFVYYLITFNNHKRKIYQMRLSGLFNSILGRRSFYRPKLND